MSTKLTATLRWDEQNPGIYGRYFVEDLSVIFFPAQYILTVKRTAS
jgi:hypothetical protein